MCKKLHSENPLLKGVAKQLRLLEAEAARLGGMPELDVVVQRLLDQIQRLSAAREEEQLLNADLAAAEDELASLNAVHGTEYRLLRPVREAAVEAAAEDTAVFAFGELRRILSGESLAACERLFQVSQGKAQAVAQTKERIVRKQAQLAQMDSFR